MNELRREGIDPADNMAMDLLRIVGPDRAIRKDWRRRAACRELGINPIDGQGSLKEWYDFKRQVIAEIKSRRRKRRVERRIDEEILSAEEDPPWTRDQYPAVARWIDENVNPKILTAPPCVMVPGWFLDWNWIARHYDRLYDEMERIYALESFVKRRFAAAEFDRAREDVALRAPTWRRLWELVEKGESARQVLTEGFVKFIDPHVPAGPLITAHGEATMIS
jgi:hypothetical protein